MFRRILTIYFYLLLFACFLIVIHFWLLNKSYLFDAENVALLASKYVGQDPQESFPKIHEALQWKYPGHILPARDLQWVFMNAGGWMGAVCILHASLTEYVLFFGTALETQGHSGRYWANVSDTILVGKFHQWKEGELHASVHTPGATVLHAWGEVTAVNFKPNTWMVEYGRGFIPSTLGFALADTFFSTLDYWTMLQLLLVYSKALCLETATTVLELTGLGPSPHYSTVT